MYSIPAFRDCLRRQIESALESLPRFGRSAREQVVSCLKAEHESVKSLQQRIVQVSSDASALADAFFQAQIELPCDLMDPDSVTQLAARVGRADAVLYLAANGDPVISAERPRWDLESNAVALVNFLTSPAAAPVLRAKGLDPP